jgi:Gas vesicle protein G
VFLADDLLMFPFKGILAICREIHKAAQNEVANEAESLRTELSRVYQMLEQGAITETDFDATEQRILDRLDEIEDREATLDAGDGDDDLDDEGEGDLYDEGEDEDDDDDGGQAYEYGRYADDDTWGSGVDHPHSP